MLFEEHEYLILQFIDVLKLIKEEIFILVQDVLYPIACLQELKQLKAVLLHAQANLPD